MRDHAEPFVLAVWNVFPELGPHTLFLAALALVVGVATLTAGAVVGAFRESEAAKTDLAKVAELRDDPAPPIPQPDTQERALEHLDRLLDRELKSVEALERKAALIPAALGVAATILAGQIDPTARHDPETIFSGVLTIVFGIGSAATAVAVFYPRRHAIGASPYVLARYTDDEVLKLMQATAIELAYACESVKMMNFVKANFLFLALIWLVGTVTTAVLFGISGGFVNGPDGEAITALGAAA